MPVHTKRSSEVRVEFNNHKQTGMTLQEIEEFCAKARTAGFGDKDKPWTAGGCLLWNLNMTRSESQK